MIDKPKFKNPTTSQPLIALVPQTGMPVIYPSRSSELLYDSLQGSSRFIRNPFGPHKLFASRPNHHW
jgi:hypothetical protein